jgi:phosphoenolpyruvate---glycerone phosphotransferase subunit DhaL
MSEAKITKSDVIDLIRHVGGKIVENRDYLSKLDTEIGDGDHGVGLAAGFSSFIGKLGEFGSADFGGLLKKGGFELIKTVGGAAGAIFGTFFTGQAVFYDANYKGKESLTLGEFSNMLTEALCQIKKRGSAQVGEKTMVDALEPALASLQDSVKGGFSFGQAFKQAAVKAREGAESTKNMVATKGRAKNLGERSLGFVDPGSMSTTLIFEAMAEYFTAKNL